MVLNLGYCSPISGPDRPPDDARTTIFRLTDASPRGIAGRERPRAAERRVAAAMARHPAASRCCRPVGRRRTAGPGGRPPGRGRSAGPAAASCSAIGDGRHGTGRRPTGSGCMVGDSARPTPDWIERPGRHPDRRDREVGRAVVADCDHARPAGGDRVDPPLAERRDIRDPLPGTTVGRGPDGRGRDTGSRRGSGRRRRTPPASRRRRASRS